MKKTLRSVLVTVLLLSVAQTGTAKDKAPVVPQQVAGRQPVFVVSIAGYDKIMNDVGFIGRLAQRDGLEKQAEAMITLFTQGKGLEGLDTKRPWGIVLNTDGTSFQPIAFLPVKDVKKLLAATAGLIGPVDERPDGILQIEALNQTLYLKETNGWLFIGQTAASLTDVPNDPTSWLDGLDKKYEIGLKLYVHNIPEMFRSLAIDSLKNLNQSLPTPEDEDEAAAEKRKAYVEAQTKMWSEMINTADQVTVGWALDTQASTSYLDSALTAIPGSVLAEKCNSLKDTTSNFTGFMLKKAAVVFNSSQTLLVDDIDQAAQGIDIAQASLLREIENSPDLTDDDSRAAAKRIVTETCDAIKATIKSGKMDFGGSWVVGDRRFLAIAGAYVSQPADLEKALNDLVEVAKKDPNFPGIKFTDVTDGDVHFHTWTSPIPADDKVNRAVGKELKVVVGFGPKSVYFAAGTEDPLSVVKKAIADSKAGATTKVPASVVDASLQPILDFVSVFTPDNEDVAALLAEVAKTPGKDHVHLQTKPQQNGVSYRLDLQEGVLKVLGLAAKQQMDKQNRNPGQ